MSRPWRNAALAGAVALLLGGCTSFADTVTAPTSATASPAPAPAGDDASCGERARPDPDRPRIALDFRLADDLRTVTGTQTVSFTPDLPVEELVFRLVPNGPDVSAAGSRLVVDAVRGDDVAGSGYELLGASDPGGAYVVELDEPLEAGETTEVELDFTLTLGTGEFERVGADEGVSWWASGAPLLAWEPSVGWARDPFVPVSGETTVSPAADTTVRVEAPADLTVLMTGAQAEPTAVDGEERRIWTSTEPVARDVSVAVGRFTTAEATTPGGVRVTAGALPEAEPTAGELADATVEAIADLEEFLGPFPYETLTVPQLPDYGGGIEYPSSILQASPSRQVLVHEVAHMWFYGMVGNSQFRDPWLDEAFATWAEAVVNPSSAEDLEPALGVRGDVGVAMDEVRTQQQYVAYVYGKGGATLMAAREAAGADGFDAAVRCYVDATAWAIATPDDVADALADLPEALEVLGEAGALDD
ncbi:M1 family aminopeptidase [Blastococcus goldschmidtiae]|uniref:M1 family aminopeptidase n=1 Tax=Blastococcus goldschmidtiae TaxID=3075546 RepID=A0ABU2K421_9ACTN|nr:M1 family aminopeptidase [Blastococcus sp. DSM 46792]MDT0274910.1 M1 family aminopeptidase [Blastococcus sp. DSM 46792]